MTKAEKIKELKKSGARLPRRVIERSVKNKIVPWLKREEIIVITGARQTGKSVLLSQIIYGDLLPQTQDVYYFNLDTPHQLDFVANPDNIINMASGKKKKIYVFIDEIQRLKEPGLFLKSIYDLHLPIKLIVSGSSALELKGKVHEALTGRKTIFHLSPFNMEELSSALFPQKNFKEVVKNDEFFKDVFNHYITYGSYPAVAMAKDGKLKLQILKEIFSSYIEKDIKSFLRVENENAFMNLVKILSSQVGNLINKDELSGSLGIHKNTLENYLFYLEQTFILDFVRPFYRNTRKELLKSPKVYFHDLGIRNFALSNFENYQFRSDKGGIFENFFYLYLKEKLEYLTSIHFWRTKAGAEVDFVIVPEVAPIPFEVKAVELREFKIGKSLRSFLQKYKPSKAYYINLSLSGKYAVENTTITFLSVRDLMKVNKF